MVKLVLQVDLLQILSLAWDHPLVTGAVVLMFSPPLFPVVVFFSPLLISTALCAVALISVGHQIESNREREIAGWNARLVDGDRLTARLVNARRRRAQGEERWQDWVQSIEPGSIWNTEGSLMDDIKVEGLKADFRADEGGTGFVEEDYLGRQIDAFREYERSFSFKTAAIAANVAANANGAVDNADLTSQVVSFPTESDASNKQIPSIFLYNLRTGGTGTRNFNEVGPFQQNSKQGTPNPRSVDRAVSGLEAFGSFDMSGVVDVEPVAPVVFTPEHQSRIFATRSATPETQVSDVAALVNMNNVAAGNGSLQSSVKSDHSFESREFLPTTTAFGGVSKKGSIFQTPVVPSAVAKPPDESLKGSTYNANLRVGNAVIYNASSEPRSDALDRQFFRRNSSRDQRVSTSSRQRRKQIAREKSARHPFQSESR